MQPRPSCLHPFFQNKFQKEPSSSRRRPVPSGLDKLITLQELTSFEQRRPNREFRTELVFNHAERTLVPPLINFHELFMSASINFNLLMLAIKGLH